VVIISLALGLFQDFSTPRKNDKPPVDWVEGVAIVIAMTVAISGLPLYAKCKPFIAVPVGHFWICQQAKGMTLNKRKEERRC
jgi:hypothetical protein